MYTVEPLYRLEAHKFFSKKDSLDVLSENWKEEIMIN